MIKMTGKFSVLVMDNDPFAVALLTHLLRNKFPSFTFLEPVESGMAAIKACLEFCRPDLLIADISMSDINGLLVCKTIRKSNWKTKVLMVTSYDIAEYANYAAQAGAQGIVQKQSITLICQAVKSIINIGVFTDNLGGAKNKADVQDEAKQEELATLWNSFLDARTAHFRLQEKKANAELSLREIEVVNLWAEGMTMREIAEELGLGVTTVRTHLQNSARKLRVKNNRALSTEWLKVSR